MIVHFRRPARKGLIKNVIDLDHWRNRHDSSYLKRAYHKLDWPTTNWTKATTKWIGLPQIGLACRKLDWPATNWIGLPQIGLGLPQIGLAYHKLDWPTTKLRHVIVNSGQLGGVFFGDKENT